MVFYVGEIVRNWGFYDVLTITNRLSTLFWTITNSNSTSVGQYLILILHRLDND